MTDTQTSYNKNEPPAARRLRRLSLELQQLTEAYRRDRDRLAREITAAVRELEQKATAA